MAADVVFDVVRFTMATTDSGTIDVTGSLGGATCKAAMFICGSNAAATADGTRDDHVATSVGMTDGTTEVTLAQTAEDAQSTTDCSNRALNIRTILVPTAGTATSARYAYSVNSMIANGVRLDVDNAPSANAEGIAILFAGGDLDAVVGELTSSSSLNGTATLATHSGSGNDNQIAFFVAAASTGTPDGNALRYSFGAAYRNSATTAPAGQCTTGMYNDSGETTTDVRQVLHTNRSAMRYSNAGAEIATYECTNINDTTVEITTRDGAFPRTLYTLALNLSNGAEAWVGASDPPTTATTKQTVTDFQPSLAGVVASFLQSTGSVTTSNDASAIGYSAFTSASEEATCDISVDGEGTGSIEKNVRHARAVNLDAYDTSITNEFRATLDSFDTDGFTLDYSAVNSTQRRFWGWAIGEAAGGVTVPLTGQEVASEQGVPGVVTSSTVVLAGQETSVEQGVPTVVTASGVTVVLSGQEAAAEQGIPVVSTAATVVLPGQEITTEQGDVTVTTAATVTLSGQEVTSEQGTPIVVTGAAVTLSGQEATAEQGGIVVDTGGDGTTVLLSGQEVSGEQGTPSPVISISVSLIGQEVASEQGAITVNTGVTLGLIGQEVTSEQGTPIVITGASVVLTGQEVNVEQGTPTVATSATVSIIGQEVSSEQSGIIVNLGDGSKTVILGGQEGTAEQGVLGVVTGAVVPLAGQEMSSEQGATTVQFGTTITLAGQEISTEQDAITVQTSAPTVLAGQEIASEQGTITVVTGAVVTLTGQEVSSEQGSPRATDAPSWQETLTLTVTITQNVQLPVTVCTFKNFDVSIG